MDSSISPSTRRRRIPPIDTAVADFRFSVESPTTPPANEPNPSSSPNLHSPSTPALPRRPKNGTKARNESRKLLAHVLGQLERRAMPPPFHDVLDFVDDKRSDTNIGVIMETVKDAVGFGHRKRDVKLHPTQSTRAAEVDQEDQDVVADQFSTEATYELMIQLRDVLTISATQGWHIFDEVDDDREINWRTASGENPALPFRRSRSASRRPSLSPSPVHGRRTHAPDLLSQCISILSSIVLEDCRHKITSPRPSRPPNALQALTLDIAQFLLYSNIHYPDVIARIGFALIPAFTTFPLEMHGRLLKFMEDSVLRGILDELAYLQGVSDILPIQSPLTKKSPSVSIQVENPWEPSDTLLLKTWTPWADSSLHQCKIYSTTISHQFPSLYYFSSLVGPLLAIILESVDLTPDSANLVFHRFSCLLHLILKKKPDAYKELLHVVAYHTPRARYHALNILHCFWPRAVGHVVVTRPFDQSLRLGIVESSNPHPATPSHLHQFTPWRFDSKHDRPPSSRDNCSSCGNSLHDFGLLCSLCMSAIHFDCFDHPEGSHFIQYSLGSDASIQRVAIVRFSGVLNNGTTANPEAISRNGHVFRPVNLFTLTLCFLCRQPLWGCTMQAWNCPSCLHFVHFACLSSELNLPPCSSTRHHSNDITINWHDLRNSCNVFYQDVLGRSEEDRSIWKFEEVHVLYATMWIQLQLLINGISLGCVVVMQKGKNTEHAKADLLDKFELHHFVKWCESRLLHGDLPRSNVLDDYLTECHLEPSAQSIMFDWPNLLHICSTLKLSTTSPHISSMPSDHLSVSEPNSSVIQQVPPSQTLEVVPLSYMRDALGRDFNICSDMVAVILLSHLNRLGLFDLMDNKFLPLPDKDMKAAHVVFPLPLGLDSSADVGTLILALEACLSDIDLSINEVGFLLLRRGLWPSHFTSGYTLQRLTRALVGWILAEDDSLATVLRDHLMERRPLPGLRSSSDGDPWPASQDWRVKESNSATNGGDYIATRRALLARYVTPWVRGLREVDPLGYSEIIYQACAEVNSEQLCCGPNDDNNVITQCDKVLRAAVKVAHVCTHLDLFDELFLFWLNSVLKHDLSRAHVPTLVKLFSREHETPQIQRQSTNLDEALTINPWRIILRIAHESADGLSRGLHWLCLLARSNIHIPLTTFMNFLKLSQQHGSFGDSLLLAKAILTSSWMETSGRQELQVLFSELHSQQASHVVEALNKNYRSAEYLSFLRISFGACLLLYGCDRSKIVDPHLISQNDIEGLPSRKLSTRSSGVADPMIIDPRIMTAIELYLSIDLDDVSCLLAKFLHSFLIHSPHLESYEVDNFILRNGRILADCAWKFYGTQKPELSDIRSRFLLRTLVVDTEPFRNVLQTSFSPLMSWEKRLHAVTRLFRAILDVIRPAFDVEDRQWQSSVTDIFYYFFNSMMSDDREEVRLAAHAYSSSLLPTHFEAISGCWDASLKASPIAERTKLVSFLLQLHAYFPTWRVLRWDTILEVLSDAESAGSTGLTAFPATALSSSQESSGETEKKLLDPETSLLRVSILLLALQLAADGIPVDGFILLRIKYHLAKATGFHDVAAIPHLNGYSFHIQLGELKDIPEISQPCINQLFHLFDAHHRVEVMSSAVVGHSTQDEKPMSLLVGSLYVDMFLVMFHTIKELTSIPLLTLKTMLESLCVVIYKYDFENRSLRHLQRPLRRAVNRVMELLTEDISYEIRQLGLSLVQGFIKRWHVVAGSLIYTVIESAVRLVTPQHYPNQDALVSQIYSFIEMVFVIYAQNGMFHNILKRQLDRDFFIALKHVVDTNAKVENGFLHQSLRELLLRDAIGHLTDVEQSDLQMSLNNLQSFIDIVFYRDYNPDLLLYAGQQLSSTARRAAESGPGSFDANPIVVIFAKLAEHNKAHAWSLLPYIETAIRILLNRTHVAGSSLTQLLRVTEPLCQRKSAFDNTLSPTSILLEVLADSLKLKTRIFSSTLKSMIEAIIAPGDSGSVTLSILSGLVDSGINYLRSYIWTDISSENDFAASLAVAKLILCVAVQDPPLMMKLSDRNGEKGLQGDLTIRAWNTLAIAALLNPAETWTSTLLSQTSVFSYTFHTAMRVYAQPQNLGSGSSTGDVNHAYLAVKIWILMAHRASMSDGLKDTSVQRVWNELWPPFEALLSAFEAEAQTGRYQTLSTLVITSVADLIVFLRTLRTPITVNTSSLIATFNRLRNVVPGDTGITKLDRTMKYISETPPETPFVSMVNQVAKDIVAAERIRAVEARIHQDRRAQDRHRKMTETRTIST